MSKLVKLSLRPYTALAILSFMREYINDENKSDHRLKAIHEACDEYQQQITENITDDQIEDAKLELHVNYITNRHPPSKKYTNGR